MNNQIKKIILIFSLLTLLFMVGCNQLPGNSGTNEIQFQDSKLEQAVRAKINKLSGALYPGDVINITELEVEKRGITSLAGIEHLKNLRELDLEDNRISNLLPLSGLTKLKELDIEDNLVSDISPLSNLVNLKELDFSENKVSDISALSSLINLEELDFEDNLVSDISVLESLIKLKELDFEKNQVSDISPLVRNTGLGNGDEVDMRYNKLDLSTGSKNMQDINTLISRGVKVKYNPQRNL